MEMVRFVIEVDINVKFLELKGKVFSVIINEFREKFIVRKDNFIYEQLEKIVKKVLEIYGNQVIKYEEFSKRVDEFGKRLIDFSMQFIRFVEIFEIVKFDVYEKKVEKVFEKVEEVYEKIGKFEEIFEGGEEKEEVLFEVVQKFEEFYKKIEEFEEKVEVKIVVEKFEEV